MFLWTIQAGAKSKEPESRESQMSELLLGFMYCPNFHGCNWLHLLQPMISIFRFDGQISSLGHPNFTAYVSILPFVYSLPPVACRRWIRGPLGRGKLASW